MVVHSLGLISAILYIALAILSHNTYGPTLMQFYGLMLPLAFISFALFWLIHRQKQEISLLPILFWAIVFRLIGLTALPIYEDDFYRYLWDGYLFAERGSPYGIAPSAYFGLETIPEKFQQVLSGINYPDIPTIYGPLLQATFLTAYLLAPGEVLALQVLYSFADIALILVLAKLAKPAYVLLYAWCPLVIKEIAFTAHPDGIGVLLMMLSILALLKSRSRMALILIGLAVAAKVFAILLVPFVLLRTRWQDWYLLPATILGCYLPFIIYQGTDLAGLLAFASEWQFNSAFYLLLLNVMDFSTVKAISAILFCSCYALLLWKFWRAKDSAELPRGDIIFGLFFLLAPVVNAWYLIWLLAFASIKPSVWAWTASVAVLLSYITGLTLNNLEMALFQQPTYALLIEYGLVLCALVWHVKARLKTSAT